MGYVQAGKKYLVLSLLPDSTRSYRCTVHHYEHPQRRLPGLTIHLQPSL